MKSKRKHNLPNLCRRGFKMKFIISEKEEFDSCFKLTRFQNKNHFNTVIYMPITITTI